MYILPLSPRNMFLLGVMINILPLSSRYRSDDVHITIFIKEHVFSWSDDVRITTFVKEPAKTKQRKEIVRKLFQFSLVL